MAEPITWRNLQNNGEEARIAQGYGMQASTAFNSMGDHFMRAINGANAGIAAEDTQRRDNLTQGLMGSLQQISTPEGLAAQRQNLFERIQGAAINAAEKSKLMGAVDSQHAILQNRILTKNAYDLSQRDTLEMPSRDLAMAAFARGNIAEGNRLSAGLSRQADYVNAGQTWQDNNTKRLNLARDYEIKESVEKRAVAEVDNSAKHRTELEKIQLIQANAQASQASTSAASQKMREEARVNADILKADAALAKSAPTAFNSAKGEERINTIIKNTAGADNKRNQRLVYAELLRTNPTMPLAVVESTLLGVDSPSDWNIFSFDSGHRSGMLKQARANLPPSPNPTAATPAEIAKVQAANVAAVVSFDPASDPAYDTGKGSAGQPPMTPAVAAKQTAKLAAADATAKELVKLKEESPPRRGSLRRELRPLRSNTPTELRPEVAAALDNVGSWARSLKGKELYQ